MPRQFFSGCAAREQTGPSDAHPAIQRIAFGSRLTHTMGLT